MADDFSFPLIYRSGGSVLPDDDEFFSPVARYVFVVRIRAVSHIPINANFKVRVRYFLKKESHTITKAIYLRSGLLASAPPRLKLSL